MIKGTISKRHADSSPLIRVSLLSLSTVLLITPSVSKIRHSSRACIYFLVVICFIYLFTALEKTHKAKQKKPTGTGNNTILLASAAGGGGLFLIVVVAIIFKCRKSRQKRNEREGGVVSMENLPDSDFCDGLTEGCSSNIAYTGDNPLYSKEVGLDTLDVTIIPREQLRYIEPLAEGAFGKVSQLTVAVIE